MVKRCPGVIQSCPEVVKRCSEVVKGCPEVGWDGKNILHYTDYKGSPSVNYSWIRDRYVPFVVGRLRSCGGLIKPQREP